MEKHKYNIFPEIVGQDFELLKGDIKNNGYDERYPIYTFEEKILDGWNRYRICKELEITPNYKEFEGSDMEALEFVMRTNKRRNLTSSQWAVIAIDSEEIVEAIQKQAKESQGARSDLTSGKKLPNVEPGRTSEKLSEMFNTNKQYIKEVAKIKKENPADLDLIRSGKQTLNEYTRGKKKQDMIVRLEDIKTKEVRRINKQYDVIVLDPPWDMKKIERDVAPGQVEFDYPTMSIEEIKAMELPMAEDCHVFTWTTQKYLPHTFEIIKEWGLKYVCCFVWHKNGGFQAFGLPQYNCEFVLYARKGTPEFIDFKQFFTCFNADRKKHSEKPDEFYDVIRRVTAGLRIDMFNRRPIEGFDVWGNEANE
jgi:N6-adenosine-specific RNA methylase IME4